MAKKYGWKDEDIITLNLPRWDKFTHTQTTSIFFNQNNIIKNNSILVMFTWRNIKLNKTISPYYFKNRIHLLENKKLQEELKKKK